MELGKFCLALSKRRRQMLGEITTVSIIKRRLQACRVHFEGHVLRQNGHLHVPETSKSAHMIGHSRERRVL